MLARCTAAITACVALGCGGEDKAAPDGGAGDGAPVSCSEAAGWTAAPPVGGGPAQETAAVAEDGKIYVLGGFRSASEIVAAVRVFDTAACAWSDGPPLPRRVHHANAAVVDGTIYVLGSMIEGFVAIGDVWAWNPKTDAGWTARASMPVGTQRGSAVVGVIGGVIYLAGGLRSGAVAQVSSYTPATDTWDTSLPPLPQNNDHGCGGVVGGKLYVTGGRMGTTASRSSQVFEYTPGGAWATKAPMPTARGGTACGVIGDRILVVGGEGNPGTPTGVFSEVEAYDAAADRWQALAPMVTPRHGMGAAVWGGALYVPGGATRELFGAADAHEVLRP
ncbi:MAG TPA: kelch repeat-containing protein [Kofleriaceae bacterium]|nr:kelch repeat-containing protein [Kofleriaceae bacterium]